MEKRLNQVMRARRSGQKGFTLIELLVVIAVLAILAAIVIFNVTGVANKGTTAACNTDTKSVQSAVDAWTSDNGVPYPTGAIVFGTAPTGITGEGSNPLPLVPNYLHTTPTSCPSFTVGANNLVSG